MSDQLMECDCQSKQWNIWQRGAKSVYAQNSLNIITEHNLKMKSNEKYVRKRQKQKDIHARTRSLAKGKTKASARAPPQK